MMGFGLCDGSSIPSTNSTRCHWFKKMSDSDEENEEKYPAPIPAQVDQLLPGNPQAVQAAAAAAAASQTYLGLWQQLRDRSKAFFRGGEVRSHESSSSSPPPLPAAAVANSVGVVAGHRFSALRFPTTTVQSPPPTLSLTRPQGQLQSLLRLLPQGGALEGEPPPDPRMPVLRLPLAVRRAFQWMQTCVDVELTLTKVAHSMQLVSTLVRLSELASLLDPTFEQLKERARRLDAAHENRHEWLKVDDAPPDPTLHYSIVHSFDDTSTVLLPLTLQWVREVAGPHIEPVDLDRAVVGGSMHPWRTTEDDSRACPKFARLLGLLLAPEPQSKHARAQRTREIKQLRGCGAAVAACRCSK